MTISDLKSIVRQQYEEGDKIVVKASKYKGGPEERGKIIRFYPQFVVVVTGKGIKNISYMDFINKVKKVIC
ncbi:MAG: hypothetical protein K0R00_918 [Herbinix sp.]|jgi:hypothetical protein|nr:hypothetical protein [Herbinix sp.]